VDSSAESTALRMNSDRLGMPSIACNSAESALNVIIPLFCCLVKVTSSDLAALLPRITCNVNGKLQVLVRK
jgi:hypothetical protein